MSTQAIPATTRWLNIVPLTLGMTWFGPFAAEVVKALTPEGAAPPVSPETAGAMIVGGALMSIAKIVRTKYERDEILDPDDPTKPLSWKRLGRQLLLQTLGRLG